MTYEILDQSVIVLRDADMGVRAFQNSCRHRGVRLADSRGRVRGGFRVPVHGWTVRGPTAPTRSCPAGTRFSEHNLEAGDIDLVPVRCETWGGFTWINLDPAAPPLHDCLEATATALDAWKVESLRTEWWYSCRLPVNWKLPIEAFVEAYHVVQTHPQLVIPTRCSHHDAATFNTEGLRRRRHPVPPRAMSDGMGGMVHPNDVADRRRLPRHRGTRRPHSSRPPAWNGALNDAITSWSRERRRRHADLDALAAGDNLEFFQCFPNWFVLPMYSESVCRIASARSVPRRR